MNRLTGKNAPYITYALVTANIVAFVISEILGGSMDNLVLIRCGAIYPPLIAEGEYWRLFTAMFLHAGIRHLLNNMLMLAVLGVVLEPSLGRIRYLLLYLLGGLAGNLLSVAIYMKSGENVVSIGASGAVFAVMGGLLWLVLCNRGQVGLYTLRQTLLMIAISLLLGFTGTNVANWAHLGGLCAGFLLAILLYRRPKLRQWT